MWRPRKWDAGEAVSGGVIMSTSPIWHFFGRDANSELSPECVSKRKSATGLARTT